VLMAPTSWFVSTFLDIDGILDLFSSSVFSTHAEANAAIFENTEGLYDYRRRLSALRPSLAPSNLNNSFQLNLVSDFRGQGQKCTLSVIGSVVGPQPLRDSSLSECIADRSDQFGIQFAIMTQD
jgi:hypothetical protein